MKIVSKILLVLLLILFHLSCEQSDQQILSGKKISGVTATDTVNLVGHWLNEGKRELFVRNLARVYEFENQRVKVNLKFPEELYYDAEDRASNEKYLAKVMRQGLTDWDVLRLNGEYGEVTNILGDPAWPQKNLVDFSEMEEFREGTQDALLTEEEMANWNGMIPGPYLEGQYWALWYNKKVAEKVGIEIKQFGMTFDDFAGYLKAIHQYNQNNPEDYVIPLYESYSWETTMLLALNLFSSYLGDSDLFLKWEISEKKLQAWHKTLKQIERISPYNPIHSSWSETDWASSHEKMLNGECLFYVNGSWMYNIWEGIDNERIYDVVPAELPSSGKNVIYPHAYSITWGVPKNVPNRQEAVKFLLAMNTPDVAEMWTRYTKCPTGIKGNLSSASLGGDQFEEFAKYVQDNYSENNYRYFWSSAWILNNDHYDTPVYFREVLDGKMTADEAMVAIRASIR
jgi:hypothetical protein